MRKKDGKEQNQVEIRNKISAVQTLHQNTYKFDLSKANDVSNTKEGKKNVEVKRKNKVFFHHTHRHWFR